MATLPAVGGDRLVPDALRPEALAGVVAPRRGRACEKGLCCVAALSSAKNATCLLGTESVLAAGRRTWKWQM